MSKVLDLNIQPIEFNGSCLCGQVRFNGCGLRDVVYCHCRQCRAGHGAIAAYSASESPRLTITQRETLRWYGSSEVVRRGFCVNCGSSLFWKRQDSASVCISAGAIDKMAGLRAARHIYVVDKAPYDEVTDNLPQFESSMNV